MADARLDGPRQRDGQVQRLVSGAQPPRRRRVLRWLLIAVLLLAVGAVVAWQTVAASRTGDSATYLTEAARITDLEDRVEAAATVAWPQDSTADLRAPADGTVTAVRVQAGDQPNSLAPLFEIDDVPLVALGSPIPVYRDLTEGLKGPDVKALEQALQRADHDPGKVDRKFTSNTTDALEDYQESNDLEETGAFTRDRALWLPPGGQITAVDVRRGDAVKPGTLLATVAIPEDIVVDAEIDQADVARVEQGATVQVTLDAFDSPLQGTVNRVALTPGDEGTYQATVAVDGPTTTLRAGMEGTARVVVDVRKDVVVVPSGAVSGSEQAPTVRVLVGDRPQVRAVELGLVTTEGAEIVDGVAPGDAIVVGEQQ